MRFIQPPRNAFTDCAYSQIMRSASVTFHKQRKFLIMKKKPASKSAFFNPRVLIGFAFCATGVLLALLAFALYPGGNAFARQNQPSAPGLQQEQAEAPLVIGVCDTAGPIEVESSGGVTTPT